MDDERVYIMDMYNRGIYPHDGFAKRKLQQSQIFPLHRNNVYFQTQAQSKIFFFFFNVSLTSASASQWR
jgi:hypothetical protein